MLARSSAVFDGVVIYGIKVEEIQSRVSFWCGALKFRIFFDLLMFACQVTQRPYPQLQQLQQSLNMCWNHSEATIAKPAGLWDSQIRTEHAHVSRRPCLLHNNHRRYARQNFYLWARSSAVFDVLILWNMASIYWKSMIKTNKMDIILREKKFNNQSFVVFPVQKDHSCSACQSCAL